MSQNNGADISAKSSYRRVLLTALFSGFGVCALLVHWLVLEHHRSLVQRIVAAQRDWLSIYSETLLYEIQIGNTIALEKKLQALVSRPNYSEVTLTIGQRSYTAKREGSDFLHAPHDRDPWKMLSWIFPVQTLDLAVSDSYGTRWGRIEAALDSRALYGPIVNSLVRFGLRGVSLLLILTALILLWTNRESRRLGMLASYIRSFSKPRLDPDSLKNLLARPPELHTQELQAIQEEFRRSITEIIDLKQKLEAEQIRGAQARVAQQVAHDIRSPLTALHIVIEQLDSVSDELRTLMRNALMRITDITNQLSRKYQPVNTLENPTAIAQGKPLRVELLPLLVEELVSEKRLEFRDRMELNIRAAAKGTHYGLFAKVDASEFKRILSNLINNAVEAVTGIAKIDIRLGGNDTCVWVEVRDSGRGIPADVIPKLGSRGFSYDKAEGAGLGLYHARTMLDGWGGQLDITSSVGSSAQGTQVTLRLPRAEAPDWFTPEIDLRENQTVVVLDDEMSIHHVWKSKLEPHHERLALNELHFTSPEEFRDWFGRSEKSSVPPLYLFDYEFGGKQETGVDLIQTLGIAERAILVSSRFEDAEIRKRCSELHIRILPKCLVGQVPVRETPSGVS